MRAARILLAFLAGVLLYQTAVVLVGGVLAAIAVPKAYFDWFGRSNLELALALLQLVGFAIPIAVLVAGGTLSIQRTLNTRPSAVLVAVLAGLIACFGYWVIASVLALPTDVPVEPYPLSVLLRQELLPPWWAASGFLAPWVGFALAAWLTLRTRAA